MRDHNLFRFVNSIDQSEAITRPSFIRYQEMMRAISGVRAEDEGTAVNKHDYLKYDH